MHSAAGLVAWLDIAFMRCRRLERASLSATEASPPGIASTGVPPLLDSPPDAQQPAGHSSGHQNLAAPATPSPYEMARSGPDRHISRLLIPSEILNFIDLLALAAHSCTRACWAMQ